ncbi:phosphatase and actin regulator 4-B-like [Mytilus trossulus]|uniref:phosphatase and actin regulator 4-B-like n=1 Tax=Mytilus trossulus TaxID=6551 RepID=UPI0030056978
MVTSGLLCHFYEKKGISLGRVVNKNAENVSGGNECREFAHNEYVPPENEHQRDVIKSFEEVQDPTNRPPAPLPNERNIDVDVQTETRKVPVLRKPVQQSQSSSSPSSSRQSQRNPQLQSSAKEDNICRELLHDRKTLIPRSQKPLPPLPPSSAIEDNIRMEPLHEDAGPPSRSQKPFPSSLPPSPSIEDIKDNNTCADITSIEVEYTQPSKTKPLNQIPDHPFKPEHELKNTSDGITNQTKCLPTRFTTESISSEHTQTINHVTPISRSAPPSPPVEEEEDKSSWDDSSNSSLEHEDETTAIDNPSYHEKEDTVSSIHSSSNEETTGIEEVQQPTTNTDKKKPVQYYPTFPKKTDDDIWTEPAEPIKVLDEETQPMELSPSLNDPNDKNKIESTSEDKSPETEK